MSVCTDSKILIDSYSAVQGKITKVTRSPRPARNLLNSQRFVYQSRGKA